MWKSAITDMLKTEMTKTNSPTKITKTNVVNNNGYKQLNSLLINQNADLKEKTDKLPLNGLISANITSNVGTVNLNLPAEIYSGGFTYFANYTITGAPTSYKIREPFSSIQYQLRQNDGSIKVYTFDRVAISQFNAFMNQNASIKDQLAEEHQYCVSESDAAITQTVFLPTPSFLGVNPDNVLTEMYMPIRDENVSRIKITFSPITDWVQFNGGTTPAIELGSVPEIRYNYISSQRTRDLIYNFVDGLRLPVWTTESLETTFTATGISKTTPTNIGSLSSGIKFAGTVIGLYKSESGGAAVDSVNMAPIRIFSYDELGLYKAKDMALTGTSNSMKIKARNTFGILPNDYDTSSNYKILPIFVSSNNPYSISSVARDYIDFGNSTKYRLILPSIATGLDSGDTYTVKATIFEIDNVQY